MIPKTDKGYACSTLNSVFTINTLNVDKSLVETDELSENQSSYYGKLKDKKTKLYFIQVHGDLFQVDNSISLAHCGDL